MPWSMRAMLRGNLACAREFRFAADSVPRRRRRSGRSHGGRPGHGRPGPRRAGQLCHSARVRARVIERPYPRRWGPGGKYPDGSGPGRREPNESSSPTPPSVPAIRSTSFSPIGLADRLLGFLFQQPADSLRPGDVLVRPAVEGFTSLNFSAANVDRLIRNGSCERPTRPSPGRAAFHGAPPTRGRSLPPAGRRPGDRGSQLL